MARVYVGTYHKYNNGSIKGGWLNLADYNTHNDFLNACRRLHKDETDPEFMIQDTEGMPDGLTCMEWLSEEEFNDIKLAMREEQQEAEGKPAINIIDYSDKAFAVVGDTKPIKEDLKKMGGTFNKRLSCGAGWIFPNKKRDAVLKYINSGEVAEVVRADRKAQDKGGEQYKEWLQEYVRATNDTYAERTKIGAVKMNNGYYLLDKPSIETRFCWHDEGPQYDEYERLTSHDDQMAEYFKKKNLSHFDQYINHIEKGTYGDTRLFWGTNRVEDCKAVFIATSDRYCKNMTLCTDDEKRAILAALKYARKCFEKRLDNYLKRYGVSKLHTWTYWADR